MLIIISIFLIGFVAATNIISFNSFPNQDVWITAKASDSEEAGTLKIPEKYFLDECGGATIYYEINDSTFYLFTKVKDGQSTTHMETFGPFTAGSPVDIIALPEGINLTLKDICYKIIPVEEITPEEMILNETNETEIINETETNTTQEEGEIKKILLSGYSVVEENKPVVNTIYYSIIGITALLLIFLTIKQNTKILHSKRKSILPEKEEEKDDKKEKPKEENEKKEEEKDEDEEIEDEISRTKKKLNDLQGKKDKKIHDIKQKLIADQKELMKLRGHPIKDSDEKPKN